MGPRRDNSTSHFVLVTSLNLEGRSISADQILAKYLNPWLRYYYFYFMKANSRHVGIGILLPFFCFSRLRHVILHLPTKFQNIRDKVMTSYPFLGPSCMYWTY